MLQVIKMMMDNITVKALRSRVR